MNLKVNNLGIFKQWNGIILVSKVGILKNMHFRTLNILTLYKSKGNFKNIYISACVYIYACMVVYILISVLKISYTTCKNFSSQKV